VRIVDVWQLRVVVDSVIYLMESGTFESIVLDLVLQLKND
jgi:hypothetical protein